MRLYSILGLWQFLYLVGVVLHGDPIKGNIGSYVKILETLNEI